MRSKLSRLSGLDILLFGLGAVCLCVWVVVGVGLYRYGLYGWPVWWGGQVGGVGAFLLITALARVIRRNRAKRKT
jgi:hypothetical protein